jgi:DNA excision repair protein ERCC-8
MEQMFSPGARQFTPIVEIGSSERCMHKKDITSLQWYPLDSGMFASASHDNNVHLWDTNSEVVIRKFNLENSIYSIDLSLCAQNHTLIAAACEDHCLHLCDIRTGKSIWKLIEHHSRVLAVKWSPGQQYLLASGSEDGTLRLWDVRKTGKSLLTYDQHLDSRDPLKQRERARNYIKSHNGAVNGIAFTPDSVKILSTGTDQVMRCWRVHDGSNEFINYSAGQGTHSGLKNVAGKSKTNPLTVSKNGELVFHPSDTMVTVFEVQTGELVNTLNFHLKKVSSCVFHPDLQHLYSAGLDSQIAVWVPQSDEQDLQSVMEAEASDKWSEDSEEELYNLV